MFVHCYLYKSRMLIVLSPSSCKKQAYLYKSRMLIVLRPSSCKKQAFTNFPITVIVVLSFHFARVPFPNL